MVTLKQGQRQKEDMPSFLCNNHLSAYLSEGLPKSSVQEENFHTGRATVSNAAPGRRFRKKNPVSFIRLYTILTDM